MHPSVIAVHRKFNPVLESDQVLWDSQNGLLFPKKEKTKTGNWKPGDGLAHGMMAWASVTGKEKRFKVMFDEPSAEFVFPEIFLQLKLQRKLRQIETRMHRKMEVDSIFYASESARGGSGSKAYDAQRMIRHPVD